MGRLFADKPSKYKTHPLIAKLRRRRQLLHINQADLAERMGYNHNIIVEVENGHLNPSFLTIINFANALGYEITLCELSKPTK